MITAIVAADKNYGIGRNNELLISIPEDLKRFSRITSGGYVIMGRKTYESLPKHPLPKRINIVITRNGTDKIEDADLKKPAFVTLETVQEWLKTIHIKTKAEKKGSVKVAVIGGGQIYAELLPYCEELYITKVFHAFEDVDTYFPNIDYMSEWDLINADEVMEHDGINFQYRRYKNTDFSVYNKKPAKKTKKKSE